MPQSKFALLVLAFLPCTALSLGADAPSSGAQSILQRAIAQMNKSDALRTEYTYREFSEELTLDKNGRTKEQHSKLQEILYLGERRYERLLARDGKQIDGVEARREEQRLQAAAAKAEKLTPEERSALREKREHDRQQNNEFWRYVPAAYEVAQLHDDSIAGRSVYVLSLTPKQDYHGKYASLFSHVKAVLFIDKQDNMLTRVDANFIDDVTFGLFLARIGEGSHMIYENVRINDEVWLPRMFDLQGTVRFLVKTVRGEEKATFSDYRKYQAESKIVSTSAP